MQLPFKASQVVLVVKNLLANAGLIPGLEDPLQEMATHSKILAWNSLWTEESDRFQSMGLQRVGRD